MNWYKIAQNKEELWMAVTLDGSFKSEPVSKDEALKKQKDFQSEGHAARIVRASRKIAQTEQTELNMGSPKINIQPYESLVDEAVNELQREQPGMLNDVTDINIDLGYGQFGSVTNVSPNTITLNMNNIKEEAAKQTGQPISGSDPSDANILKFYIKQTIVHEHAHLGNMWDSDDPSNPFPGGESVADRAQNEWVQSQPSF